MSTSKFKRKLNSVIKLNSSYKFFKMNLEQISFLKCHNKRKLQTQMLCYNHTKTWTTRSTEVSRRLMRGKRTHTKRSLSPARFWTTLWLTVKKLLLNIQNRIPKPQASHHIKVLDTTPILKNIKILRQGLVIHKAILSNQAMLIWTITANMTETDTSRKKVLFK